MKRKSFWIAFLLCIALTLFKIPVRAADCDVIINLKGFSVPRIEDFRLVESVDKPAVINNKEEIVVLKRYVLVEPSNIYYKDIFLVDSTRVRERKLDEVSELAREEVNYKHFWINSFTVCYKKSDMRVLYYDLYLITDERSKNEILKAVLFHRKLYGETELGHLGSISDYRSYCSAIDRGILFDSDSDGIFESFFFCLPRLLPVENVSLEDNLSKERNKILNCVLAKKSEPVSIQNLVSAWRIYRENPSSENARKLLEAIPTQSVDKWGIIFHPAFLRLKKHLEETRGEKVKSMMPNEKSMWLFMEKHLDFIKRQAYLGDPNAVRILFKFYRLFYHSYLFQGKIDIVLDELSLINPDLFLKILNENSDLNLVILLDTYIGLDFVNETNDRYANIKNKIDVFNKVSDSTLTQIRDKCLNALIKTKKEIEESGLLIRAAN